MSFSNFTHDVERRVKPDGEIHYETIVFTYMGQGGPILGVNLPGNAPPQVTIDNHLPLPAVEPRPYGLTGLIRGKRYCFCDCEDEELITAARKFLDTGEGLKKVFCLAMEFAKKLKFSTDPAENED
jgi:hypothetical protein